MQGLANACVHGVLRALGKDDDRASGRQNLRSRKGDLCTGTNHVPAPNMLCSNPESSFMGQGLQPFRVQNLLSTAHIQQQL
jgi:hypothetical protein